MCRSDTAADPSLTNLRAALCTLLPIKLVIANKCLFSQWLQGVNYG